MSDQPLVSIIIPCYKQAECLAESIDSAVAQTYRPIEIFIVNDGSPDDTEKVALGYGDQIVYIYRDNGGLSAARNTAIARARGSYMKFMAGCSRRRWCAKSAASTRNSDSPRTGTFSARLGC